MPLDRALQLQQQVRQGVQPYTDPGLTGFANKDEANKYGQQVHVPYFDYLRQMPSAFAPAYRSISQQFQPQMARARAYFGGNPAAANSGNAAKLNRLLQQSAYTQLGNALGDQSAKGVDLLGDLIRARVGARQQQQATEQEKKRNAGDYIAAGIGAVGSALA